MPSIRKHSSTRRSRLSFTAILNRKIARNSIVIRFCIGFSILLGICAVVALFHGSTKPFETDISANEAANIVNARKILQSVNLQSESEFKSEIVALEPQRILSAGQANIQQPSQLVNITNCENFKRTINAEVPLNEFEFIQTPGWTDSIEYEWQAEQSYKQLITTLQLQPPSQGSQGNSIGLEPTQNQIAGHSLQKPDACNVVEPKLLGNKTLTQEWKASVDIDEIVGKKLEVEVGGQWSPVPVDGNQALSNGCPKLAVIISAQKSDWNALVTLLSVLHPILQRQQVDYHLFVAEQFVGTNSQLNVGAIFNAAFIAAMNLSQFDCIVFHDVYLVPSNDYNLYNCEESPTQFAVNIEHGTENTVVESNGGNGLCLSVFGFTPEHFVLVNGYSNMYWTNKAVAGNSNQEGTAELEPGINGAAAAIMEDLRIRTIAANLNIWKPSAEIGSYKCLNQHKQQCVNRPSFTEMDCNLLANAPVHYHLDGINSIHFRLLKLVYEELYTHLLIDVGIQGAQTENK